MVYRVVVWGTGNAGRPAIRAVAAHADLELAGVVVANPEKVGRDAGELAYITPLGVNATDDVTIAFADDIDAVVYTATADTRPDDAFADLIACLEAGANVVSTSFYPLLHPASAPAPMVEAVERACAMGDTSVFVSGIDPGWALDILPLLVSGVSAGIEEIRVQEIFNYALYDAPAVVREVIGFGGSMESTPLMLLDVALEMVWAPMVRILAEALDVELEAVVTHVGAPPPRTHRRRARYGHLRRRYAGRVPVRGAGCRQRPTAPGGGARDADRRRVRARLAGVDRTGWDPPRARHRAPDPRGHDPRHRARRAGCGRRRECHRGESNRERRASGVRRPRRPAQRARSAADHRRGAAPPGLTGQTIGHAGSASGAPSTSGA